MCRAYAIIKKTGNALLIFTILSPKFLLLSIIINTCTIVSKLHSFTMHDMKSTLMLTFFTMTPENFRFDKRYQIFKFFESPSEKYFRSFLFYGYKKEVRTSDNKETLQALPHIDFSLINIFTDSVYVFLFELMY